MIFSKIQGSLRAKIFLSFLLLSFVPLFILLGYTLFYTKEEILSKTFNDQANKAEFTIQLIQSHLNNIQKETRFLASLNIMDDLLAEDIDKRISILLKQKADDLGIDVTLYALDTQNKILASSKLKSLLTEFKYPQKLQAKNSYFIKGDKVYFYVDIFASFDSRRSLGHLVMRYNLNNLTRYLNHQDEMQVYLFNTYNKTSIGDTPKENIAFKLHAKELITSKYLIVHKQFSGILKNYILVYSITKEHALKSINNFIYLTLLLLFVLVFLLIYFSLKYSKNIVTPIKKLTEVTQSIISKQNYHLELDVNSSDEIATLTKSFNQMLFTTATALEDLKKENKLRLRRFTQLIEIFNTIILTHNESECINTSLVEIKKLLQKENVTFHSEPQENSIDIFVTDFVVKQKNYYGSILFSSTKLDTNEIGFFNSIASMIGLQLDRIRLISKTMATSNAKSSFIASMSHELRTPLNSIIGATQYLITYEKSTDTQLDSLANIESSAHYLLNMINDILDMAKIEAGKVTTHLQDYDPKPLLQESFDILQVLADEKELDYDLDTQSLTLPSLITDKKMFQQIIINLLSNAIKFTQNGSISLKATSNEKEFIIQVSDTGIGIEPQDMQKLFGEFTQISTLMHKTQQGTGLGLALSKKMASLLNATLTLHSEGQNKGTQAIFTLKL